MSQSRYFVVGPPKCGKSVFAENLFDSVKEPIVYIATLPNHERFLHKIEQHRSRRDSRWKILEIRNEWQESLAQARRRLAFSNYLLLDGLSMLLWFYIFSNCSSRPCHYESLRNDVLELLKSFKGTWLVVDALQECASEVDRSDLCEMSLDFQSSIGNLATSTYVFKDCQNFELQSGKIFPFSGKGA